MDRFNGFLEFLKLYLFMDRAMNITVAAYVMAKLATSKAKGLTPNIFENIEEEALGDAYFQFARYLSRVGPRPTFYHGDDL